MAKSQNERQTKCLGLAAIVPCGRILSPTYIHAYIHIHTYMRLREREREREREGERERERESHRERLGRYRYT